MAVDDLDCAGRTLARRCAERRLQLCRRAGRRRVRDRLGGRNRGWSGRLRELATHTSGLPRLAPNHPAIRGRANPYARYTPERAEKGLLGLVLTRAAGRTYQELLSERILVPLAMTSSGVGAAGGGTRLPGHAAGRVVPHWDFLLPGPGGVEATIGDLARHLQAALAPPDTALGAAIRLAQAPQFRVDDHREIALGWIVRGGGIRWHNGGTGGFTASVAIDRAQRRGLAALVSDHAWAAGLLDTAVLRALSEG
jgi:CubicO group peptidase (beta-lactamase class C family)